MKWHNVIIVKIGQLLMRFGWTLISANSNVIYDYHKMAAVESRKMALLNQMTHPFVTDVSSVYRRVGVQERSLSKIALFSYMNVPTKTLMDPPK